jgi:hypothetical protein
MLVKIAGNTTQFQGSMAQAQKSLKSLEQTSLQTSATLTKALSFAGAYVGAQQLFGVIQGATGTIRDFEQQMATVQAITGATAGEFDQLRSSAISLSKASQFTAIQIAELQTEFGRLGFSTQEILNATEATLDLSTATGEDLAKSADVLGSTLRAFGKDASETGKVADIMAGSFNRSALGLENFSEAIKYVAPVAAAAGISLEETTAVLGVLADNGIRGSMAGTSFRKIISDLGTESGTLTEKFKKLAAQGLSGADAMDEVGRTAYASLLILANNADKTEKLTQSLHKVGGESKATADIVGNTLAGDIKKLNAAYDALVLSGGALGEQLRELVQAGTNLINAFNNEGTNRILSFFKTLISYTPNIYTLAKAINALFPSFKQQQEDVKKLIKQAYDLREAAKMRGDQKSVIEYTKIIADLSSKYKLLTDKALEYKEENPFKPEEIDISIESLDRLKQQLQNLTNQYIAYSKTVDSTKDLEKLQSIDDEIKATKNLIDIIEKYRKKTEESNKEKRKEFPLFDASRQSIYDLAAAYVQLKEDIKKSQEELSKFLNSFNAVTKLPEQININEGLAAQMAGIKETLRKTAKEIKIDIGPMLAGSIAGVAEALGNAIGSQDFSNFGNNILEAVASFAQQLGAQLIALGVAEVALKFAASNPVALIAAGAALVAAGAAVKSSLSKQGNVISSAGSGGGYSGGNYSSSSVGSMTSEAQDTRVEVVGVIRGEDIWIAGRNYEQGRRFTNTTGG